MLGSLVSNWRRPSLCLGQLVCCSFNFSCLVFLTVFVGMSRCWLRPSPSPSVVVISSNPPSEYKETEDIVLIRADRFPFQTPTFLEVSGDATTLAESFLAVHKANATTFKLLKGLAKHQAAEAEVKAVRKCYCAAQCTLHVAQLEVNTYHVHHLEAWLLLDSLFGKGCYCNLGHILTSCPSS